MASTPPPLPGPGPRVSALAIWSLGLGLIGFFLCLPALAGIPLALASLIQIKRNPHALRGTGLAVGGLIVSVLALFFFLFAATFTRKTIERMNAVAEKAANRPLSEARQEFTTHLARREQTGEPVPKPPTGVLNLVSYHSPVGDFPAYLSPIPSDGRKHPAIVWLTGGFSNSISEVAWERAPLDNDQSARAFRENGVVTLYPSLRGGNMNPGYHETYFGEVEDVLAATDFLAAQPGIDPERIYLGGHSTGGTLALLVAESSPRFRAVFAFGPAAHITDYGSDVLTFDTSNSIETLVRDPEAWLRGIRSATYVLEGDTEPSNTDSLRALRRNSKNALIHFHEISGKTHFSILSSHTPEIARQILSDTAAKAQFNFSSIERAR